MRITSRGQVGLLPYPMQRQVSIRLPAQLLDEIDRLCGDPVGLSRPSRFPFRPVGQLFSCPPFEHDEATYWVTIAFRYGSDEKTIWIEYIARTVRH